MPTLSYYGDLSIADSASQARAFVGDVAIQPHGEVAMHGDMATHGDMAITSHGGMAIRIHGETAFAPLYRPARVAPTLSEGGSIDTPT